MTCCSPSECSITLLQPKRSLAAQTGTITLHCTAPHTCACMRRLFCLLQLLQSNCLVHPDTVDKLTQQTIQLPLSVGCKATCWMVCRSSRSKLDHSSFCLLPLLGTGFLDSFVCCTSCKATFWTLLSAAVPARQLSGLIFLLQFLQGNFLDLSFCCSSCKATFWMTCKNCICPA